MRDLRGKVAAITGAGSGIGRALAINLAREGCELAVSDIDVNGLEETEKILSTTDAKVTCHQVDVADRTQVYQFADETVNQHSRVDMIINNAGVSVADSVQGLSYEDFEWVMGINFWGVVYGCKAFLPYLMERPEGHIVNISSINGFVSWPHHSPYCSAKFAVKGFSESLLQETDGTPVRVSCVHPGGIKTNIARNARFREAANKSLDRDNMVRAFDRVARTTADEAARIIIAGVRKNKRRILVGTDAYIIDWLTRLFPVQFVKLVGKLVKLSK